MQVAGKQMLPKMKTIYSRGKGVNLSVMSDFL